MKPTAPPRGWRHKLTPIVERLRPLTATVERVASIAVHVNSRKLTPLSVIGLASAAVNGVAPYTDRERDRGFNIDLMSSKSHTIEAFEAGGATVRSVDEGRTQARITLHGEDIQLLRDGSITLPALPSTEFATWLAQMFDRTLPAVMVIGSGDGDGHDALYTSTPSTLTNLRSIQGAAIAEATGPLIDAAGRCILLDGRPGVGKSTMAQEIARLLGLGRTVILEHGALGSSTNSSRPTGIRLKTTIRMLNPGVVIVDDFDKAMLPLADLEALRGAARLVILTSNNGQHDDVLDAATTRPGRIDEVFHVTAEHSMRRPPFDQLTDEAWAEVCEWPIASLNELEKRIRARGANIRLDDLRDRLTRKTRSGDNLH